MTSGASVAKGLPIIAIGILGLLALIKCHRTELEDDGFKVLEKHETYYLVEKDGHRYIATETGWYNMSWQFEHDPNCPCFKTQK